MTTLSEHKVTLIHAACEIAVLGAVIFWFQKKTNNMWNKIEELSALAKAQQEIIEKQEEMLQQHNAALQKIYAAMGATQVPETPKKPPHKRPPLAPRMSHSKSQPNAPKPVVEQFVDDNDLLQTEEELEDDDFGETESEMDDALREEFEEYGLDEKKA